MRRSGQPSRPSATTCPACEESFPATACGAPAQFPSHQRGPRDVSLDVNVAVFTGPNPRFHYFAKKRFAECRIKIDGKQTLFYASSGIQQAWRGAAARKSPAYTTDWGLIRIKAG